MENLRRQEDSFFQRKRISIFFWKETSEYNYVYSLKNISIWKHL